MRNLILFIALALPSLGAIANVQHGNKDCAGVNVCTFTWGSATTANNLIVVHISSTANFDILTAGADVKDSGGNNLTRVRMQINADTFSINWVYYLQNAPSGTTIVVTQDLGATNSLTVQPSEWSGAATSSVLDTTNSHNATDCTTTDCEISGSITTAGTGELIFGGFTQSGGSAYSGAGTGYTLLNASSFIKAAAEYKIGSAAGSEQAVITGTETTVEYVAIIAAFKAKPSSGGCITLLGVGSC